MSSSTYKTKVITGLVLLILCFGVAYFVTTPIWNKYNLAKSQLASTQAETESLNRSLSQVENFITTYENHTADVEAVSLALPAKTSGAADLVGGLNALATASGVVLGDLGLDETSISEKPTAANSIQPVQIKMSVSGTYESFKDFTLRLENHLRISNIQKVTFAANEDGLMKFSMIVETYYQK